MRLVPTWLRSYDRTWLPVDVTAGLTVWAVMVPQALAYAGIAGVPVQNGLYVMPLAVVGYLLLGSSRHLYVGPSATVATLSASTVALVATASTDSADYIALTFALTLMVGVIYIAGGLARMGFVSRFFARPVLEGFIVGLAVAWTRRRYPPLQMAPARWIRPAVAPVAARLRRVIWYGVLAAATPIVIILVLLIVKP